MLIPYELADKNIIKIDVSEEVAQVFADFRREEASYKRQLRRRKVVLTSALYEDEGWEATDSEVDILADYIAKEEKEELTAAIAQMSEADKEVIDYVYYKGKSAKEYAELKGISFQAVYKRLEKIYAKLKNILS